MGEGLVSKANSPRIQIFPAFFSLQLPISKTRAFLSPYSPLFVESRMSVSRYSWFFHELQRKFLLFHERHVMKSNFIVHLDFLPFFKRRKLFFGFCASQNPPR